MYLRNGNNSSTFAKRLGREIQLSFRVPRISHISSGDPLRAYNWSASKRQVFPTLFFPTIRLTRPNRSICRCSNALLHCTMEAVQDIGHFMLLVADDDWDSQGLAPVFVCVGLA